jgi:hypothetical protein
LQNSPHLGGSTANPKKPNQLLPTSKTDYGTLLVEESMEEEKILTLHPEEDKSGVNISRAKYEMIRQAILNAVRSQGTISYKGLVSLIDYNLRNRFEGSISWYVTTVKLDLEARGEIERIPGPGEQRLRLKK